MGVVLISLHSKYFYRDYDCDVKKLADNLNNVASKSVSRNPQGSP